MKRLLFNSGRVLQYGVPAAGTVAVLWTTERQFAVNAKENVTQPSLISDLYEVDLKQLISQ